MVVAMFKKTILLFIIIGLLPNITIKAQVARNYVPNYIKSDFFEKFPDFYKYRLGQRIKYYPVPENELLKKPDTLVFTSSDGVQSVNISGPIWTNAQTETWISINPADPLNIIATSNDNAYLSGFDNWRMSAFVTTDGGKSWFHSPTPRNQSKWFTPHQNQATIFDPAVTFDSKGNVYYAYGFSETAFDNEPGKNKNGVFVVKSTDKGKTWNGIQNGSDNGIMPITFDAFASSGNPFHDRYTMTADRNPNSPYKDYVYITWRVFGGLDGVVLSVSSDGGESWSAYKRISSGGQAPMPVTGPNGELYITWIAPDFNNQARAMFAKSENAGFTFSSIIEVQKVFSIGTYDNTNGRNGLTNKQNIRVSSVPQIAVDNSNSPFRGSIYIVQAGRETPNGPYGIYLAISRNGGNSWTKNIRIDNNTLRNDLFFPSITVCPQTGIIAVFYYSSQNDPSNVGVDGYVAISQDGGTTWRHLRVTPETKYLNSQSAVMPQGLSGGVYWGDYTSITSHNGMFYPLYWMPTNGNLFSSNDLFTAFISPAPQAPSNLATTTIFEPNLGAKITWDHPTKNLLGDLISDFKINIYKDENKIAEVKSTDAPQYIDNNVVLGETYLYHLETELPNGYKSNKVSIAALIGGNPKPMAVENLRWEPTDDGIILHWTNPTKNIENKEFKDKLIIRIYEEDNNIILASLDDNIIPGEKVTYKLKVPTEKFYKINVKAVGVRNNIETESDFYFPGLIAYSGAPLKEINENFDDDELIPYYKTGDWQISNLKAKSLPNALADGPEGNYKRGIVQFLILPPVIIQSGKTTFSFDHIALLDPYMQGNATDFGEIAISLDFGKTWKGLKWVNANSSDKFKLGDLKNSEFDELALSFAEYLNDTIMIRFLIETNNFREAEGWFIDNLKMDERPANVSEDILTNTIVQIYPNPINSNSKLMIKIPIDGNIYWQIYNSLGSLIKSSNVSYLSNGNYEFNLDINNLPIGVYYLKIKINNFVKTIPFSIVN